MNDRRVGPPGRASRGGGRPPATMATQARYQPPMASYTPRPVGPWQALRTADGKHVYYHNAATNETTWTRPPDYVDPGPPGGLFPASGSVAAAPSAGSSAPSSVTQIPVPGTTWYEVTQPGKPSYFHDAATRAVVWAPPPAVLEARTTSRTFSATGVVPPRDATETTRKRAREETDAASNAKETSKTAATRADPESPRRKETPLDDDDDVEFDPEAYEDDCFEEIEEEPVRGAAGVEDAVAVGTDLFVPREVARDLAPNDDASPPSVETDAERAAREFRELLTEKGVDKTSRWDRKARELSSDSRFKAVRSHAERRRLFERHARDAGDAAKKEPDDETKKAEKRNEKAAAARAEARREKAHFARLSARELADANVARLRVKNARDVASERFGVLLAESEKKWNLAESTPPAFDDAKKALFADAQGRATAVPGAFEEADMRALFEAHVARAIHARLVDVAELLDEKLVARSAKDFEVGVPDSDADVLDSDADDDESGKKNPLASFVAASAFEPLVSDPRWDRCPVEQRAAAYCRRVEALCSELNVGDVPEDVAALRDALAEAREKRLKKKTGGDDEPEEGEAVDDGAS